MLNLISFVEMGKPGMHLMFNGHLAVMSAIRPFMDLVIYPRLMHKLCKCAHWCQNSTRLHSLCISLENNNITVWMKYVKLQTSHTI